jgi:hypothetical protein
MFAKFKLKVLYNCHIFVNIDLVYKSKTLQLFNRFPHQSIFYFLKIG